MLPTRSRLIFEDITVCLANVKEICIDNDFSSTFFKDFREGKTSFSHKNFKRKKVFGVLKCFVIWRNTCTKAESSCIVFLRSTDDLRGFHLLQENLQSRISTTGLVLKVLSQYSTDLKRNGARLYCAFTLVSFQWVRVVFTFYNKFKYRTLEIPFFEIPFKWRGLEIPDFHELNFCNLVIFRS